MTWVQPEDLLRHELWQRAREPLADSDRNRLETIRRDWQEAGGAPLPPHAGASPELGDRSLRELAVRLLAEIAALPSPPDPAQPDHWSDIEAIVGPAADAQRTAPSTTPDALLGAWTGRAVGCVLGKPVEKIPRTGIEEILRATGRWPLRRYFTAAGLPADTAERWPWNRASGPTSLEENIDGTPEDDDLNFPLMALRLLETHGVGFDSGDVAAAWLADLPAGRTFTAERVAYRNLLCGLEPPATARADNPFREWIGAQIRTDVYGWTNPGDPRRAAALAHRDAAVSHTRNGLYSAMALAAMGAIAVSSDPDLHDPAVHVEAVLDAGAAVVPPTSATAEAIDLGRRLARDGVRPEEAYPLLEQHYEDLHWVHALNNTALVAYALSHGAGAFDLSICTVVAGGWDTDSNGASVGGIVGALVGAAAIDPYWTRPLAGHLTSSVPGEARPSFVELARRTAAVSSDPGGAQR